MNNNQFTVKKPAPGTKSKQKFLYEIILSENDNYIGSITVYEHETISRSNNPTVVIKPSNNESHELLKINIDQKEQFFLWCRASGKAQVHLYRLYDENGKLHKLFTQFHPRRQLQGIATFACDKTPQEIIDLFIKAGSFAPGKYTGEVNSNFAQPKRLESTSSTLSRIEIGKFITGEPGAIQQVISYAKNLPVLGDLTDGLTSQILRETVATLPTAGKASEDENTLIALNAITHHTAKVMRNLQHYAEIQENLQQATGLVLNEAYLHATRMLEEVLTMSLNANSTWASNQLENNEFTVYSKNAHDESLRQIHDLTILSQNEVSSLVDMLRSAQEISKNLEQKKRAEAIGDVSSEIASYYMLKTSGQLAVDSNNRAINYLDALNEVIELHNSKMYSIARELPTARLQSFTPRAIEPVKKKWWKRN